MPFGEQMSCSRGGSDAATKWMVSRCHQFESYTIIWPQNKWDELAQNWYGDLKHFMMYIYILGIVVPNDIHYVSRHGTGLESPTRQNMNFGNITCWKQCHMPRQVPFQSCLGSSQASLCRRIFGNSSCHLSVRPFFARSSLPCLDPKSWQVWNVKLKSTMELG